MYVEPRHLLWLLPVFAMLFASGMVLGYVTDEKRGAVPSVGRAWDIEERAEADQKLLKQVLMQLAADEEQPFAVQVNGGELQGRFRGEWFTLEGKIAGNHVVMKREPKGLAVAWNGEESGGDLHAPYALFTPYEHLRLIEQHLGELKPLPVLDPDRPNRTGYHLSLPPDAVKTMLAAWLGPSFPTEEVFDRAFNRVAIGYQLWLDTPSNRLAELTVEMSLEQRGRVKRDQLSFQLLAKSTEDRR